MAQTGQELVVVSGPMTNIGFLREKEKMLKAAEEKLAREGKEIVNIIESLPTSILGLKTQEIRVIWRIPEKPAAPEIVQYTPPAPVNTVQKREESVYVTSENYNAIVERIFLFLEDKEWERADYYCEQALNFSPKSGVLYLAKLMAELKVSAKDDLRNEKKPFDELENCIKASRFDAGIAKELEADNEFIRTRNEEEHNQNIYEFATAVMNAADTRGDIKIKTKRHKWEIEHKDQNTPNAYFAYDTAANEFGKILGFKDADALAEFCSEKAKEAHCDLKYYNANEMASENSVSSLEKAIKLYEEITDWKDSREKIDECKAKIDEVKAAEEKAESERKRKAEEEKAAKEAAKEESLKKTRKYTLIGLVATITLVVFISLLTKVIIPSADYKRALRGVEAGNYEEAYSLFNKHPDYKDSSYQGGYARGLEIGGFILNGKYDEAEKLAEEMNSIDAYKKRMYTEAEKAIEAKDYDTAYAIYEKLRDNEKINESKYNRAFEFLNAGDYDSAYKLYTEIERYNESQKLYDGIIKIHPEIPFKYAKVGDRVYFGKYSNDDSEKKTIDWIVLAKEKNRVLVISDDAIDNKPYEESASHASWETCSLRKWLNDRFYKAAFSKTEQDYIMTSKVTADKNPEYDTDPGKDSMDKLFLLSVTEVEKYLKDKINRECQLINIKYDYCDWWLRTPGKNEEYTSIVDWDGWITTEKSVREFNEYTNKWMDAPSEGVRPAMWIEI